MTNCIHCDEEILPGERLSEPNGFLHWECAIRAVVGGVNHQKGLCMCCGNLAMPPDPPGLTRREAAKEAADYWQMRRNMDLILRNKGMKD